MKPYLIAKILPTKKDGKRSIGTGYPIGNGLVLTARHVVVFKERDLNVPVSVEWPDLEHESVPAEIVFDGGETLDLALLKCSLPPEAKAISTNILSRQVPDLSGRWDSLGYPRLSKSKSTGERALDSAFGEFHHPNGTHVINLTSKSDAEQKDNWKGISGAAVFQGEKIFAVISSTPEDRAECFQGVYLPWLFQNNAKFRLALGLDDLDTACQKFVEAQKRLIQELLEQIKEDSLFTELARKLNLKPEHTASLVLADKLVVAFDEDCLSLYDLLLQAASDALKQNFSEQAIENTKELFCLFISLMASESLVAREAYIGLSVYSPMATELHLAPLFDTSPDFITSEDGEVKGRYAIEASNISPKEVGWDEAAFTQEAIKLVYTDVRQKPPPEVINAFEIKKLNTTIKHRQNRSLNQLHRFELNRSNKDLQTNPLHIPSHCEALNAVDCLPDLPIVHYGEEEAPDEAELSAKLDELFEILKRYGYAQ